MVVLPLSLIIAAMALTGLLAGASLDQSIKQLPAHHLIGVDAFFTYSRAADLGNGIPFYATLGIGAAVLCLGAAITVWMSPSAASSRLPLVLAAGLALLHSGMTALAAPTNFSQRGVSEDAEALTRRFNRLTFLQTHRAILPVLTFGVLLWGDRGGSLN